MRDTRYFSLHPLKYIMRGNKIANPVTYTETDNPLSDTGYEHITVARDLTVPDLDLLRFIEHIAPSEYTGDCIPPPPFPLTFLSLAFCQLEL